MSIKISATLLILSMLLTGCFFFHQGHQTIITGIVRPKIDDDDVRFFLSPPARYEVIAIITAQAHQMTRNNRINDMLDEFRKGAAGVGANGVLLDASQVAVLPGTPSGPYSQDSVVGFLNTDENLRAQAIYYGPDALIHAQVPETKSEAPQAAVAATTSASYATVVVTDTGDSGKNLRIANKTCIKLGKVAKFSKKRDNGTLVYICVDVMH
ncbi:MAG: hypothetical protein KGQ73_02830 [Gammaproteobacteria bacterium]|nr:hypothetical protein [Gammaproteobacteria bacterium]